MAAVGLHRRTRAALGQVVARSGQFRWCGFFGGAAEALEGIVKAPPRLVVVSLALGKDCGVAFARRLLARLAGIGILLVAGLPDDAALQRRAAASGIADFLVEPVDAQRLECRLRSTLALSAMASGAGPAAGKEQPPERLEEIDLHAGSAYAQRRLRGIESEIVGCLDEGLIYKEIAARVGRSLASVRKHVHRIYERFEKHTRTEALNEWRRKP